MTRILTGSLGHLHMVTVLKIVASERLTGWLRVEDEVEVGLLNGYAVEARSRRLTGYPALMQLFFTAAQHFTVDAGKPSGTSPIAPMAHIIREGRQLQQTWATLQERVLVCDRDFLPDPPAAQVIAWLDGRKSLAEAAECAGVKLGAVVAELGRLVAEGILRQSERPAPEPEVVPGPLGAADDVTDVQAPTRWRPALEVLAEPAASPLFAVTALRAGDLPEMERIKPRRMARPSDLEPADGRQKALAGLSENQRDDSRGRAFLAWVRRGSNPVG